MQDRASVFDDTTSDAIQANALLGQRSHPRLARRIEARPVCLSAPLLPSITSPYHIHSAHGIHRVGIEYFDIWSQWQGLENIGVVRAVAIGDPIEPGQAALVRIVVREPERDIVKQSILSRLKDLHAAAADEDMTIHLDSERDFRLYVLEQMRPNRKPAVTLLENGNLRALWSDASGQQVGLQFRGDGWVQYVLFARTMPDQTLATSVGRKMFNATLESVRQMGLHRLIYT
jgi:hypothetical protein